MFGVQVQQHISTARLTLRFSKCEGVRVSKKTYSPLFSQLSRFAILVSLGTWQMQRFAMERKSHCPHRSAHGPKAAPTRCQKSTPMKIFISPSQSRAVFCMIKKFMSFTSLPNPKGKYGGVGYWVITPLQTDQGLVWINRGFVPVERKQVERRQQGLLQNTVSFTALLRANKSAAFSTARMMA